MKLESNQLASGLRLVKLTGRLDLEGVDQVETEFMNHCAGEKPRLLVDLAGVTFIASTGFRLLLNAAKVVAGRGGKMGFINPTVGLRDMLDIIGVLTVIPIYADLGAAEKAMP